MSFPRSWVFEAQEAPFYLASKARGSLPFFLLYQWAHLDWQMPDVVLGMPGFKKIAISFAELLSCPYVDLLQDGTCDAKAVEEEKILLVIDEYSALSDLQKATHALSETFPKKGYILSVFGDTTE